MVRIQVIKASKLAVTAALILLAIVLALLSLRDDSGGREQTSAVTGGEAVAAFANASALPLVPGETRAPVAGGVRVEVVTSQPAPEDDFHPRVLIYHTHTYEAYSQVAGDPYQETEKWRTADQTHSVVQVGEALSVLLENAGCQVTHDITDHELPDLRTAYTRSLKTLEGYAARGEQFDLYIDLHRNAYSQGMRTCAVIGGQELAELMLMVGRGENYRDKPDFEANYAYAVRVTQAINAQADGLCRDVLVRTGRYNQHVGTPAVLIEVGHNENTLNQALASMPYLADGLLAGLRGGAS